MNVALDLQKAAPSAPAVRSFDVISLSPRYTRLPVVFFENCSDTLRCVYAASLVFIIEVAGLPIEEVAGPNHGRRNTHAALGAREEGFDKLACLHYVCGANHGIDLGEDFNDNRQGGLSSHRLPSRLSDG